MKIDKARQVRAPFVFVALITLTLVLTSCSAPRGGIVMIDDSYKASVFLSNADSISSPDGLFWKDGTLYINDEGGISVERWTREKGVQTLMDQSSGALSPEDLVMDPQGNIFFTDDDDGGLHEIDNTGAYHVVADKNTGMISTEGIALTPDGTFLVGDGEQHEVFQVTRDGKVSVYLGPEKGITKAETMAFDENGNLFIGDNDDDVLYLLDKDKVLHRLISHQEGFSPETLTWHDGALFITDSRHGKVFRYSSQDGLKTIAVFGGKLKNVQGITVSAEGDIYISVQSDLKHRLGYILKLEKIQR